MIIVVHFLHLCLCVADVTFGGSDYSEREDMYDEIIRLKKVKYNNVQWLSALMNKYVHSVLRITGGKQKTWLVSWPINQK